MAQTTSGNLDGTFAGRAGALSKALPAPQAYQILRVAFTVAPIVAGLDKFFHLLVDRDMYLAPVIAKLSPVGGHGLMLIAGPVEIVAGLPVAIKPRIGAYVVSAWLPGIVINLLLIPGYYDIALRDFGLSPGGLALARLSAQFDVIQPDDEKRFLPLLHSRGSETAPCLLRRVP
jgi:hypothetical protein